MSKTLAAIIATYEARRGAQTAQEPAPPALTPKGAAIRTVYQLRRQMVALGPEGRAAVHAGLVALVDEIGAGTPA